VSDGPKTVAVTAAVHDYLVAHGTPPDAVQRDLIERTAALGDVAGMQIAPEQGAFMEVLTRLLGVRAAVEVGTFTGYSALCIARGLVPGGRLLCCDVSETWTAIAREHWERAGVADRIDLRLGAALGTIATLPTDEHLDLVFVDADKEHYLAYYEALLPRVRRNGVLLVDNTLWDGAVVDASVTDASTTAIREFNDRVASDDRVEVVMLPISDGLTLIRKR